MLKKEKKKRAMKFSFLLFFVILVSACSTTNAPPSTTTNKKEYSLTASVKDLSGPVINVDGGPFNFFVGDSFDLNSKITVVDNFDKKINYSVTGFYDLSKANSYSVKITAKDTAGNASSKEIVISVKEKPKEEPNSEISKNNVAPSTPSTPSLPPTVPPTPVSDPPTSKTFLLADGYTLNGGNNAADIACSNYIRSNMKAGYIGSCDIVQSENGPLGMRANFTKLP